MARVLLVLALSALGASAYAKDLCIQLDNSSFAGSQIVVKKAKVGAGSAAPAQGYFARFSQASLAFSAFEPLAGQSLVSTSGTLALGMTRYAALLIAPGGNGNGTVTTAINCVCNGGPDKKLNVPDSCGIFVADTFANGHVVDCTAAVDLP
jgi:hypothetical protein